MTLSETRLPTFTDRSPSPERELAALDITTEPRWRSVWWSAADSEGLETVPPDLPAGGFASPWGYWFGPPGGADGASTAFGVTVHDPSEFSAAAPLRRSGPRHTGRVPRTITLSTRGHEADGVRLVIGDTAALVFARSPLWEGLAEPVLLAVAQHHRYSAMERTFVALQNEARRDLLHTATAGFQTVRQGRRLVETARTVCELVSDWTYFAGSCADPFRTCSSEESVEVYTQLAEELDFDGWAERIDDMAEDVEGTYELISDKLFHYRLFLWGMGVEAVVIGLIAGLLF